MVDKSVAELRKELEQAESAEWAALAPWLRATFSNICSIPTDVGRRERERVQEIRRALEQAERS